MARAVARPAAFETKDLPARRLLLQAHALLRRAGTAARIDLAALLPLDGALRGETAPVLVFLRVGWRRVAWMSGGRGWDGRDGTSH